jgi:hypothetical protein
MAQAGLINAMQTSPNDPTQLLGDPAMNPSQQQIADVQQAPVRQALPHAYQQYHQQRQARQSAGGMMANRAMAQTPMTQQIQQSRVSAQNGGSMYINQGFGSLEGQNMPQYTVEQGQHDHPTEDFGESATPALTQEQQFQMYKQKEEDGARAREQGDKENTDYQASLQGTGKYATQNARLGMEQKKVDASMAKEAGKHGLLSQPAAPGPVTTEETASPEGQAQAAEAKPVAAPTGVKAIHPEGQMLQDPRTGKRYIVQNGQYVEQ